MHGKNVHEPVQKAADKNDSWMRSPILKPNRTGQGHPWWRKEDHEIGMAL